MAARRTCRVCGCSDNDPCPGGCGWLPGKDNLCTACEAAKSHKIRTITSRKLTVSVCRCGWVMTTSTAHCNKRERLNRAHLAAIVGVKL